MRFGDDAQFLNQSWVEPYTGPPVSCESCVDAWVAAGRCARKPERATHTVVLDADEGRFVSVCRGHLKAYESERK